MSSVQIEIKRTNFKALTKVEESFTTFQRFMLVNRKKSNSEYCTKCREQVHNISYDNIGLQNSTILRSSTQSGDRTRMYL